MREVAVAVLCFAGSIACVQAQSIAVPSEQPVIQAAALPDYPVPLPPDEQPIDQTGSLPATRQPAIQAAASPDYPVPLQPAEQPTGQTSSPPAPQQVAATCPGNPDALGTSRVITVAPGEFSRLGLIQYKQTLPLRDHEVVLTFDDGPIPPYSNIILDTLESQCVKATYFMVGEMAHAYPAIARRIYNAGMTIGTHSQHHPFGFERLPMQRVEREVDGGIASVDAALGDEPNVTAPFFRIPGFGRTKAIEAFLQSKGLVVWSADIDTDDWWRGSSPGAVVQRAMRRLNQKGRGIILMHDIHPATALALPMLLKQLKANGYRVVQVVASGERPKLVPDLVATAAERKGNWPRVLRVSQDKTGSPKTAVRHSIRKLLASRHHRVKTAGLPMTDYSAAAREWQEKSQF